jgi:TRAP-type C4-dicarboxylate transport system substrate-binding protein
VNLDALKKLKPAHQKAVLSVAKRLEPEFWKVSAAADVKNAATLTNHGLQIRQPSAGLIADMRKAALPMWGAYAKSVGEPAGSILKDYQAAVSK